MELRRWPNGYLCEMEFSNVIQVIFLWPRCAPERQLGNQWRKVCRIRVLTRPRIRTALAKCQAVPNCQACLATGIAGTRMSRTSIVVTTGIGIIVTGIGDSAYVGLSPYTRSAPATAYKTEEWSVLNSHRPFGGLAC